MFGKGYDMLGNGYNMLVRYVTCFVKGYNMLGQICNIW